MHKQNTLRIWELSALVGLCLCLLAGTWSEARLSSISARLVRLHVLAASDAPEEQALKLRGAHPVLVADHDFLFDHVLTFPFLFARLRVNETSRPT